MPARTVQRFLPWFALLIQAGLACGCASTASLPHLQPAENAMAGVRRVAVLPIAGPPEQATVAQQALLATLNSTGRFRLIGPAELELAASQPLYRPDGSLDRVAALAAARKNRADAVLLATVHIDERAGNNPGSLPFLGAEPTVTFACRLEMIDVRNGEILLDDQVQQSHSGALSDSGSEATSRLKVHQRLAASTATAAARKITPHQVASDVPLVATTLGESNAALRRGNSLAREGQWNDALRQWRGALAQDPENHGAMYSIGLAFEAQGDFPRAQQWYREAIERSEKTLYRQALERVRSAAQEYQLAQAQIQASREIMPASPAWREPWSDHPYGSTISLAAGWRIAPKTGRESGYSQLADATPVGQEVATANELRRLPDDTAPQTQESRVHDAYGRVPLHR